MKDNLKIAGFLELRGYENGHLVWVKRGKNLIVTGGRQALLDCFKGTSNKYISKIQAGTNATTPELTDVLITNPINITDVTITATAATITIEFNFGEDLGTGTNIAEFGIILADGTLFSRKTVNQFTKVSGLSVKGTWTINLG